MKSQPHRHPQVTPTIPECAGRTRLVLWWNTQELMTWSGQPLMRWLTSMYAYYNMSIAGTVVVDINRAMTLMDHMKGSRRKY